MDAIDNALAAADRAWRAYGVGPADRAALGADLRLDLAAAAADGREPADLLGPDVAGFARRLVDEAGVPRQLPDYRRLLATALLGAALGGAAAVAELAILLPLLAGALDAQVRVPVQVAVGFFYGPPALLVVVGALLAVRIRLRQLVRIRPTVWAMTLLLPVAGLLLTPLTMGFARLTGYSTSAPAVLAEVAIVLAGLGGATVLARRWAMREGPAPAPIVAAPV